VICPTGGPADVVSSARVKNISLPRLVETVIEQTHPVPHRGAFRDRHGRRARDAVDAAAFARDGIAGQVERPVSDQQHADERRCCVRRSRVVLTPRRWRQGCGYWVGPTGRGHNISPQTTVAKKPGHRGARNKPLKPLRAGMPGDAGVLVVTRVLSTNTKCTRGRGCSGHPAFPTPSKGAEDKCTARAHRAARSRSRVCTSLRAQRSNPWLQQEERWIAARRPVMPGLDPGIHPSS
jgi:hypothetical protein